jgi:hypothetical protein
VKAKNGMIKVKCRDPRLGVRGQKICERSRFVPVQSAARVKRCVPCQRRYAQLYRNARDRAVRAYDTMRQAEREYAEGRNTACPVCGLPPSRRVTQGIVYREAGHCDCSSTLVRAALARAVEDTRRGLDPAVYAVGI